MEKLLSKLLNKKQKKKHLLCSRNAFLAEKIKFIYNVFLEINQGKK